MGAIGGIAWLFGAVQTLLEGQRETKEALARLEAKVDRLGASASPPVE